MDMVDIGPAPYEEECAQVGCDDFTKKNIAECRAFKAQIVRAYGEPPAGASLRNRRNQHEFGTYREVAIQIDDSQSMEQAEKAWEYANLVESDRDGKLAIWDAHARAELGLSSEVVASTTPA